MLYYVVALVLCIYFELYHRFTRHGVKNIPNDRPCIFASNHASYLDPPAVGYAVFPRHIRFVAIDTLFKNPLFGWLIRTMGAVPVSQENKNSSASLLRMVMGFLKDGSSVFICPEGSRTLTGELGELEGGVALMAIKTNSPIVPTWCGGTFRAMAPDMTFPRPVKVYIEFGEPIYMEDLPQDVKDREKIAIILDKINEFYKKKDAEDKAAGLLKVRK